jgi:hypothetical protein
MKIRIGDRVRLKNEGEWGTVVWRGNRSLWHWVYAWLILLDDGCYAWRSTRQLEKCPRYRGIPEARDTATAQEHLRRFYR